MINTFPKDIQDCMKDCIMAILWPKKDIIGFFEDSSCTLRELPNSLQIKDMTRKAIIDYVFKQLLLRGDNGLGQFRAMLKSLVEWDYFDDYWFVDQKKLDKKKALEKINHLRGLADKRDSKIKNDRIEKERQKKELTAKKVDMVKLKEKYISLFTGKDEMKREITTQKRGYLFEAFIVELFSAYNIEISQAFKITGEQIDGAIKYEGEYYIMELKWQNNLIASDALYQFAYKVDGKLYGRGIFISIQGFSKTSVDALTTGKGINMILIDGGDLMLVLEQVCSLKDMLDNKIRCAQTMGRIYVNAMDSNPKEGKDY